MHSSTVLVTDKEIPAMRWFFLFGWIAILGGTSWVTQSDHRFEVSIWWPIGLTTLSVLLGWQLGYKRLIGPLFSGFVLLREGYPKKDK